MNIFSNIDVVNKAIEASLTRKDLISQNIAHADTPGYKRQDIDFESLLAREVQKNGKENIDIQRLSPKIYTDHQTSAYRMDGNNVDIQVERSEESKVEMRYNTLVSRITSQLGRLESTLQNLK